MSKGFHEAGTTNKNVDCALAERIVPAVDDVISWEIERQVVLVMVILLGEGRTNV